MRLLLKEFRRARGLTQADMADKLGVQTARYGSWERGARMINLDTAFNCAVILDCTLNDLVGMHSGRRFADTRQEAINGHYETFNESGKDTVAGLVESLSHDPSLRLKKDRAEDDETRRQMEA